MRLYAELKEEERKVYNWIKGEVMLLMRKDTKRVKFTAVLSTILHLCQVCADVALCPSDLGNTFRLSLEGIYSPCHTVEIVDIYLEPVWEVTELLFFFF